MNNVNNMNINNNLIVNNNTKNNNLITNNNNKVPTAQRLNLQQKQPKKVEKTAKTTFEKIKKAPKKASNSIIKRIYSKISKSVIAKGVATGVGLLLVAAGVVTLAATALVPPTAIITVPVGVGAAIVGGLIVASLYM